jgi:hypothetical protein
MPELAPVINMTCLPDPSTNHLQGARPEIVAFQPRLRYTSRPPSWEAVLLGSVTLSTERRANQPDNFGAADRAALARCRAAGSGRARALAEGQWKASPLIPGHPSSRVSEIRTADRDRRRKRIAVTERAAAGRVLAAGGAFGWAKVGNPTRARVESEIRDHVRACV